MWFHRIMPLTTSTILLLPLMAILSIIINVHTSRINQVNRTRHIIQQQPIHPLYPLMLLNLLPFVSSKKIFRPVIIPCIPLAIVIGPSPMFLVRIIPSTRSTPCNQHPDVSPYPNNHQIQCPHPSPNQGWYPTPHFNRLPSKNHGRSNS